MKSSVFITLSTVSLLSLAHTAMASSIITDPGPITLNTSSLFGETGTLDFQFNGDSSASQIINSTVNFTDSLGLVSINNGYTSNNLINEQTQAITFGNTLTFDPVFTTDSTTVPGASGLNSFLLFIQQPTGTVVTTGDTNTPNAAVIITQNVDGSLNPTQIFSPFNPAASAAPEPGPLAILSLAGLGIATMIASARRRTLQN